MAELGSTLARGLGGLALGSKLHRRLIIPGGGCALRLAGIRHRLLRRLGLVARGLRRSRGFTPAREDQPSLGNPDLLGKLAVALGRARLAAKRSGALLHFDE